MAEHAAEYQHRLVEEVRTLSTPQVRRVLDFVEELKRGPTEETLMRMLGRSGVPPEDIEDVCEDLRRSGLVTPRLLRALRALGEARAPQAEEEERISALLQRNRDATITQPEKEELARLVRSGERMNLTKAGALVALKVLTGGLPARGKGMR